MCKIVSFEEYKKKKTDKEYYDKIKKTIEDVKKKYGKGNNDQRNFIIE